MTKTAPQACPICGKPADPKRRPFCSARCATIGVQKPANLAVIVFDNSVYGETGGQPSHTGSGIDLVATARACGIGNCYDVSDEAGLADLAARLKSLKATLFARVAIEAEEPPRVLPEKDGVALKQRFRAALGVKA